MTMKQNEAGIWVDEVEKFVKREKMTRAEWAVYHDQEEITEETYLEECKTYQYILNRNLS